MAPLERGMSDLLGCTDKFWVVGFTFQGLTAVYGRGFTDY